jgi:hypothetical protein
MFGGRFGLRTTLADDFIKMKYASQKEERFPYMSSSQKFGDGKVFVLSGLKL